MIVALFLVFKNGNEELKQKAVEGAIDVSKELVTYEMTDQEVEDLPSTEIVEQTEEQEEAVSQEQKIEGEGFQLQDESNITYEGERALTWDVELGDYKGLTYYSQIDSRWSSKMYSSIGDRNQTIGSSGCGPTSAAMVVTATKGAITPDRMADLFVKYGYRSADNGTYWGAFRAIADQFNIEYAEMSNVNNALNLLRNNYYVITSVGNGLFTTGGHFIVLTGLEGNTISIYDPYLYSGKFETATRRGKVTVSGNTVYCSVDNFKSYANAKGFFCYAHDANVAVNNQPVSTGSYTRYVNTQRLGLNLRSTPGGTIIGSLTKGTQVKVDGTSGAWSHIVSPKVGWVSTSYLASYSTSASVSQPKITGYRTGNYKVTASVLNVRSGPGTNYKTKSYKQLTANARTQNRKLGNYYTNGLRRGVVCTVSRVSGNWGLIPSGWICLSYCNAI